MQKYLTYLHRHAHASRLALVEPHVRFLTHWRTSNPSTVIEGRVIKTWVRTLRGLKNSRCSVSRASEDASSLMLCGFGHEGIFQQPERKRIHRAPSYLLSRVHGAFSSRCNNFSSPFSFIELRLTFFNFRNIKKALIPLFFDLFFPNKIICKYVLSQILPDISQLFKSTESIMGKKEKTSKWIVINLMI